MIAAVVLGGVLALALVAIGVLTGIATVAYLERNDQWP